MNTEELQKIIKAAELVNSNLHVQEVLKNIVHVAVEITRADRGTLYLVDNEKNEIWSLFASGDNVKEIRLKIGEGLAGYVAHHGNTINITDARQDSRFKSNFDLSTGYKTDTVLCFPIKNTHKEIVGVLQLLNKREGIFDDRDEKFLNALSIHAALAINNSLMIQKQISINEELRIAKQEVEKFAMLRVHFLAQMSHEIRTPLNIIIGGMELLKLNLGKDISEENTEVFQMLESGSARIIRTIEEILQLSKIRAGDYDLQIENINLESEIFQPLVTKYKKEALKKNLEFTYIKTTDKDQVTGDRYMINQIFTEIIDNAIKYTFKGSVTVEQFENTENKLCVKIKDTGIGISDEYFKLIFEPFTQEHTGYSRKFEGNGLALALIKKYAELNNILIDVKSEKNVGSEFFITFI
jgi:signal transduction histidine kinase